MARIRSIRPEFWTRENHASLSPTARLVILGLISHADDAGRVEGSPVLLAQRLFPFQRQGQKALEKAIMELESTTPPEIIRYRVDGQAYIQLPGFRDPLSWQFQMIQHPSASRLPERTHEGYSAPHEGSQRKREWESGIGNGNGKRESGEGVGEGAAPLPPDAGVAAPRPDRAKLAGRLSALGSDEAVELLKTPAKRRDGAWVLNALAILGKSGFWDTPTVTNGAGVVTQ